MKTIKTAVSLPTELYTNVEKLRKKLGKSRSQMVAEALAKVVREVEIKEMEARDNEAYRLHPETEEELAEARAMNAQVYERLAKEEGDVDWRKYFPTL